MDFIDKQIAPPKSWEKFEDLTRALFAAVWEDPLTQKNGRTGQKQQGVDVFGTPSTKPGEVFGVQCKGKNGSYGSKASIEEFESELAKAENFKPPLSHWTFATTAANDGPLQEYARIASERRHKEGRFPVNAIGWETIQALFSSHPNVIEEFYPEHAGHLLQIIAMLRAMLGVDELDQFRRNVTGLLPGEIVPAASASNWSEVQFETARDLGPALMGRSLGPADVVACPELPEVEILIADLERAGSARLAGVPGAGKSICILQTACKLRGRGWRVLRLADPTDRATPFDNNPLPTLYLIDDAHLTRPALLRDLEERATESQWILSAHTVSEDKGGYPGAIQLDTKRAVRVIAEGLKSDPKATLAAVRRADDRVGDRPGQEPLNQRLEHAAEQSLFPWQFCFILGGGWRRASSMASSARAAGADLILAAAAIHQLASRDTRCSHDMLTTLVGDENSNDDTDAAIKWLVSQRVLLAYNDLRCPHQRLASVLLQRILDGQSDEGRKIIANILERVLLDERTPMGGISVLLRELANAGQFRQWTKLVQTEWLLPILKRCWNAFTPIEIRNACWVLNSLHGYLTEEEFDIPGHIEILASWIEAAPEDTCYAIGWVINDIWNTHPKLGEEIVNLVNPRGMALSINKANPLHTGEIANLISMIRAGNNHKWKIHYLEGIDRDACQRKVSTWPKNAYLAVAADLCEHFCFFAPEFGFTLIESLIPAISDRLRANPQQEFHEINDIVWNSLRLYDPLGIYVGKLAPTGRMRQVGRKICACWQPDELAAKLSRSTERHFQSAAGLLSFMKEAAPKRFEQTVLALDWQLIDQNIGANWAYDIGEARMLLGIAYSVREARPAIEAMVQRNESNIVTMSPHLAAIAPSSAARHLSAGKLIALSPWGHVDWNMGTLVIAQLIQTEPTLVGALLEPNYDGLATALSQPSPTFYNDGLLLLCLIAQVGPAGLTPVLDRIDIDKAERGWQNALRGVENNRERGAKAEARQVASLLIHHALNRNDAVGALARRLRQDFPRQSIPAIKTLQQIDLTTPIE
ncbi:hypothetical protein ACIOYV_12775 [Pseudomonas sp. NPDC087342]|uniref:hypothetical protein n=1 Tax=Pseudomonas sp. NPDC087342 TaxID=3364437 RepID=UPI0037F8383B